MYAFTITTKHKCRHCINDFDAELLKYLKSKGVNLVDVFYKVEYAKFTKWHAHGQYATKWETDKHEMFYVHFREIDDPDKWRSYCNKSLLDVGTPFFIEED